ncbi:presenilin [Holotrichia oblita]|uniref:Presenilin n=1 Tax=Holotrichia oblita TaxID=644536 RepID=A0ACB9TLY9_HOLOL|nr:presenilin [Holotrichia oblita]
MFLNVVTCANENDKVFVEISKSEFRNALADSVLAIWNSIKDQAKSEDTFVGEKMFWYWQEVKIYYSHSGLCTRCYNNYAEILTLLSVKGLGIGILLLIMNVAGWAAKIGSWKSQLEHQHSHHAPQNVHFHLHKDDDHYTVGHTGPSGGWHDRISDGLSKTTTLAEKIELFNLYKRLGFNVDKSMLPQFR